MVTKAISTKDLAEKSFIPRMTLARRLAGASSFTVDELERIAPILGKTPSDFFTESAA